MRRIILVTVVLAAAMVLTALTALNADDSKKLTGKRFSQLMQGGLLYDNWPAELGIKIDRTHPSYPKEGKKAGKSTWRCKECHGWDYKGKDGAYSSGSHYTGIPGIRPASGRDPHKIAEVLKNETHSLDGIMPEEGFDALALFIAYGQIDTDLYIERDTRKSIGDRIKGERIYMATCVKCHGMDGKEINFKDEKKPEYVGTVANKNPWETLHKIRWGHPGSQMISLIFLGLTDQLDVLAYTQELPVK